MMCQGDLTRKEKGPETERVQQGDTNPRTLFRNLGRDDKKKIRRPEVWLRTGKETRAIPGKRVASGGLRGGSISGPHLRRLRVFSWGKEKGPYRGQSKLSGTLTPGKDERGKGGPIFCVERSLTRNIQKVGRPPKGKKKGGAKTFYTTVHAVTQEKNRVNGVPISPYKTRG